MKTDMRQAERKTVTVWTPWGAQILDREETGRSRFRKRLEFRRQREERKAVSPKPEAVRT